MSRLSVLASLAVLVLAGCAAAGDPTVTPPPTPEITATTEPTAAPSPSVEPIAVRVTFDGEQCVYEGPRVFLDGTEVLFTFDPTDEWADHSALIVGYVSRGMSLDEVRADTSSRAAHDQPPYLMSYEASYGPGTVRHTMSSMPFVRRPSSGALVVCLTDPETTDDAFFADLLTIAGG
jgi:hypothetical protein